MRDILCFTLWASLLVWALLWQFVFPIVGILWLAGWLR